MGNKLQTVAMEIDTTANNNEHPGKQIKKFVNDTLKQYPGDTQVLIKTTIHIVKDEFAEYTDEQLKEIINKADKPKDRVIYITLDSKVLKEWIEQGEP